MRDSQLMVLGIVLALAAPAAAQDRPPDWLKKPTPEMLRALYPTKAVRKAANGKATISCTITVQGALRACTVVSESPADMGFGGAALALAPQLLFKPALQNGKPVEATVSIPINWKGMESLSAAMPASQSDKVYTNLPWKRAPTAADLLAVYPAKAKEERIGGLAIIDCKIGKEGALSHCTTVREAPANKGFGAAAKKLAPLFVTPVETSDGGTAAGSRAHVSVAFATDALDSARPAIGKPKWVGVPQVNDMAAVIPEAAKKANVYKARVVLECGVVADGAVDQCQVVSQDPAGLSYGDAAVALSKFFRLAVWTEEGLPVVGGRVRIPLRFDAEPPQPAPVAKAN